MFLVVVQHGQLHLLVMLLLVAVEEMEDPVVQTMEIQEHLVPEEVLLDIQVLVV